MKRSLPSVPWLWLWLLLLLAASQPGAFLHAQDTKEKPNVLIILADDMGYGDVQCYNPERGKILTPHLDRLAAQGMRFTDAHSSSGVCSPTRYSLLTGRYHWRSRLQAGIVPLWGKPLIAPDRLTIAGLAKQHGYHTACIGKWHLGWDWPFTPEQAPHFGGVSGNRTGSATEENRAVWREVFSKPIPGGPTTRGFDEYFGTDVPNWPPYCFIENDRTVGVPSELLPASKLGGKPPQASNQGPALPEWKLEDILPTLGDRATRYVETRAKSGTPFLLYLPLTSPHTPISVSAEWQGKSTLGPYGDFVMQTDSVVGRVLEALEKSGVAERTLVIFTSDNGCAPTAAPKELEAKGHFPSGPWRGYKAEAWEGGHRVPFIVRWPGKVQPGTISSQTLCSVDIMATLAGVLGASLPANAGEDSVSLLPLLRGEDVAVHEAVVHQSALGVFAIREGKWKLIFAGTPGSDSSDDPAGATPKVMLYDLANDPGETTDLQAKEPEVAARLTVRMEQYLANGRSTPGASQQNDVAIKLYKASGPGRKRGATGK